MRRAADGRICFQMMILKLAGVDFVGMALGRKAKREAVLCPPTRARLPKARRSVRPGGSSVGASARSQ